MKPVCRQERSEEAVKFYNYNFALISTHGGTHCWKLPIAFIPKFKRSRLAWLDFIFAF